jgi:hypothetical protein
MGPVRVLMSRWIISNSAVMELRLFYPVKEPVSGVYLCFEYGVSHFLKCG